MVEYHILNLGAGVQSTTLYLMFAQGLITPQIDAAIFADTQDEPSEVYRHLEWLESLDGPRIIRTTVGKLSSDLMLGMNSSGQRWVSIPAFTAGTGNGDEGRLGRQCSKEYKIIPIQRAIRRQVLGLAPGKRVARGITVHQYLGISLDESGRAGRIQKAMRPKYIQIHFPLIEMFMARQHCLTFLDGACPHPVPKSACKFCPFHDDREWHRQQQEAPDEFAESVAIDEQLRSLAVTANRKRKNNTAMYLHRSLKPLVQIDFGATSPEPKQQSWLGFSRECLGVCGV